MSIISNISSRRLYVLSATSFVAALLLLALPARADQLPNGDKLVVQWYDVTIGTDATNLVTSSNVTGVTTSVTEGTTTKTYESGLRYGAFANLADNNNDTYAVAYMFDIYLGEITKEGRAKEVVLKLTPINYSGQYATDRTEDFKNEWMVKEKNWWPTTFIVQGSNDGTTFTKEIARFSCLGLENGTDRTYTDITPYLTPAIDISSYSYIRLINDASKEAALLPWGGWNTQFGLSELGVYDAAKCTVKEKMTLTKQGSSTPTIFTKLLDKSMARSYKAMSVVPNTDGTPSVSTNAPQLTENPDNGKLSESEKEYESTDDLPNMLDGDNSTFFHSTWYVGSTSSNEYKAAPTEYHYIQIDLGKDGARNNFAIYMNPRVNKAPNLMPMHIAVYASNTGQTADADWKTAKGTDGNPVWTKLIELEDTRGEQYFSDLLWTKEEYRYLRLVNEQSYPENQYVHAIWNGWNHELEPSGTNADPHAQPYFCLSEFQLCSADNVTLKSVTENGVTTYYEVQKGANTVTYTQMLPADKTITSATVPDAVTIDGTSYNVTAVSNVAFTGCDKLSTVSLGKNVTSVGTGTFIGTKSLSSITVDKDNTQYDSQDGTFLESHSVLYDGQTLLVYPEAKTDTHFTLPDDIVAIDQLAFYDARYLKGVKLPDGNLNTIASCAFQEATALKAVTIPKSVTTIGRGAFEGCSALEAAYIHGGAIGDKAFYNDSKLKTLNFYYDDGIYETANDTEPTKYAYKSCRSNVTSIGEKAFYGTLKSTDTDATTVLDIPRSVTSIGENAFYGCSQIVTLKDHSQTTTIPNSYSTMTGLKEAYLYSSKLADVTAWGWTTNALQGNAFYDCTSLTDLYLYTPNVIAASGDWLTHCGDVSKHTLHVFADLKDRYAKAESNSFVGTSSFVSRADSIKPLTAELTVGHASGIVGSKTYTASPYSSGVYEWPIKLPEGMKAYTATGETYTGDGDGASTTYLKITELELSDGILPANTPVILEAASGNESTSYTQELYSQATTTASGNKLQGCAYDYYDGVTSNGDVWCMTYDTDGYAEFRKVKANVVVPKGKIYIKNSDISSPPSSVRAIMIELGETTGITELSTETKAIEERETVIYDLQGRRVTNPTRGIYIINGKKVYVR